MQQINREFGKIMSPIAKVLTWKGMIAKYKQIETLKKNDKKLTC